MSMHTPTPDAPAASSRRAEDVVLAPRDPEGHLGRALAPAIRFWWMVPLGLVLGVALGFAMRGDDGPRYRASATVYLGQPVNQSGSIVDTITSQAAIGLELARGEESLRSASKATGVPARRIREGLSVAAVQSPLGSKLTSAPAIMRVTVEDREREVAERAATSVAEHMVDVTGGYTRATIENGEASIEALETRMERLEQTSAQLIRSGGEDDALVSMVVANELDRVRNDLRNARAELALAKEVESRVLDEAIAQRVARAEGGSPLVVAGVVGAVLGALAALAAGRMRKS